MNDDDRKLVLVVDPDERFVAETRALASPHRTLGARGLDEAREIVLGGRVDVLVLGPAFASEHSIGGVAAFRAAAPGMQIVLAADIVTNRLLKAALRAGFADVLDLPITPGVLAGLLPGAGAPDAGPEISVVVEPASLEDERPPVIPAHHPSQYVPEPEETLGSGWMDPPARSVPSPAEHVVSAPAMPQPIAPQVSPMPDPAPAQPVRPVVPDVPAPSIPTPPVPVVPVDPPAAPRPVEPAPWVPPAEAIPTGPVWPDEPSTFQQPPVEAQRIAPPAPAAPVAPTWDPPVVERPAEAPQPWSAPVEPAMPPSAPPPPPPDVARVPEPPATPPPLAPVPSPFAETPAPRVPAAPRRPGNGRVIAVMAGKGGSGKSVVATNLAIAMGLRSDPERIAIVDADLQFGDIALMLQIDPVRTLDDVVGQLDSMTDARLDGALLRHESGLRVLPAPLLPVRKDEIDAKSVVEVVDRLRALYDTIVVDTGPVFDDGLVTILEHADAVVTVVDMDLPSVKNAKVALDALRGSGFPMEKITLVVNRVNSKARLDLVELERSLGLRVGGSVPSDRLVPQSVNEGIPLLALSPRSKVARSFMALAERLDPRADRARLSGGGR